MISRVQAVSAYLSLEDGASQGKTPEPIPRTMTILYRSVRERQIPYDFTYMWNLKNKINEQTKMKPTHRYREQTDGCQKGGRFGDWVKR